MRCRSRRVTDGRSSAKAAIVAIPLALWPEIEFEPPLPDDKLGPARQNHAGRMKKTWMVVGGIPDNLFASGWGTDFVQMFPEDESRTGCMVIGMCSPPSELDTSDLAGGRGGGAPVRPGGGGARHRRPRVGQRPLRKGLAGTSRRRASSHYHSALGRREGRLAFAGADVAVRWIGWIDGALESGAKAASEVLALLDG